jgi:hypothetical protein
MEVINSFFSNIKDKLSNPYFGTLILVLLIHHWQLWYTVFNFDSDCSQADKVLFIQNYANANLSFWPFAYDVVLAAGYMLLGYLIIVATRSLVMWVEFWLMPFITGKVVNKNVVRKSDYDEVVKEREEYFDQYEEQRKNLRVFSKTIDEQTEQIKQKDDDILKQSETFSKSIGELDSTNKNLANTQAENKDLAIQIKNLNNSIEELKEDQNLKERKLKTYSELFFDQKNKPFYSSTDKFPPEVIEKVQELKKENLWQLFLRLGNFFENGGTLGGEVLSIMIEKGVAFEREIREDFTPLGRIIWNYRDVFESYDVY